jgi:aminopeptidase YwaD
MGENVEVRMTAIHFRAHALTALEATRSLIERFGPRLAGTPGCQGAGQALQEELKAVCGQAELEPFRTHPNAFMGHFKINAVLYLVCTVLLCLRLPVIAALGFTFIIISGFAEFGYYHEFFDRLYPARDCANLVARLEPQEEATCQVILSGHHDSAYTLNFLNRFQKLYALKVLIPDVMYTTGFLFAWFWWFSGGLTGKDPEFAPYVNAFLVIGILFAVTKFFIVSPRGTPGAGDNLIASTMVVELAKLFTSADAAGHSALCHTRLMLVSFDAEESGLRGSRAFAARHRAELQALPTYMFNIDSIYQLKELQFLTTDLNGTVKLSREVAETCARLAEQAGYPHKSARMVFGGGGTDAAELARVGVQATTLLAMDTALVRDGLVYHTIHDTVEAVEPQAVEACLRIAYEFVWEIEGTSLYPPAPSPLRVREARPPTSGERGAELSPFLGDLSGWFKMG